MPPITPTANKPHPDRPTEILLIVQAAAKWHISPITLWGVYGTESGYGENLGPSSAGAVGPFQFLPSTARSLGVDPMNFRSAVFGAAEYLHKLGADSNPNSGKTAAALNRYSGGGGSHYVSTVKAKGATFRHDNPASAAVNAVTGAAGGVFDTATAIPRFLGKLDVIFDAGFWRRVGFVILGIAAFLLGGVLIGKEFSPLGQVAKFARKA